MSIDQVMPTCSLPNSKIKNIRLGHGSGGRLTSDLLEQVFCKHLDAADDAGEDAAIIELGDVRIAISTDSYVIQPIVFPGSDIGALAVNGTINDVAMRGGIATHITAAFILEEGLALSELEPIIASMAHACRQAGVKFCAGDTKVVNKGAGDKLFITTTGIGKLIVDQPPSSKRLQPGDVIIVSGDLGRHGAAVMCARESLNLQVDIESDCAAMHELARAIFATGAPVHCLRDITRGGLATVLNELAAASQVAINVQEKLIPLNGQVQSVCELLGLDPLYVACEGRLVCVTPAEHADSVLAAMRRHPLAEQAVPIGTVDAGQAGRVVCRTLIGGNRILDKLSGEQLPRIC